MHECMMKEIARVRKMNAEMSAVSGALEGWEQDEGEAHGGKRTMHTRSSNACVMWNNSKKDFRKNNNKYIFLKTHLTQIWKNWKLPKRK